MSALLNALATLALSHKEATNQHRLTPLNSLRNLALSLGNGYDPMPTITESDLQVAWAKLQTWLDSGKPPSALEMDIWNKLPDLLWREYNGQAAIASLRLREGLAWAAAMSVPRARWVISLIRAYTEAREAPEESRRWLGETLRRWMREEPHPSLGIWRQRDESLELLSPRDFPARICRNISASADRSMETTLRDAGLASAPAMVGDLSKEAFLACLRDRVESGRGYDAAQLSLIREWFGLLIGESAVWSKDLSASVINGLLEPWASFNPRDVTFQKLIIETLEKWFGKVPERWTEHWTGASERSREILARWKILDVMEAYFERVATYARRLEQNNGQDMMRRHWQYRRPFWLAFYRRGVVTRAKALIGRGLLEEFGGKSLRAEFGDAMAQFDSKATKHHCALLLEINGLIVVDLSHNGKAYFFLPGNTTKPSLSAFTHSRDRLEATADEALTHQGSETYSWQRSFAELIYRHTRISVNQNEYSLRS